MTPLTSCVNDTVEGNGCDVFLMPALGFLPYLHPGYKTSYMKYDCVHVGMIVFMHAWLCTCTHDYVHICMIMYVYAWLCSCTHDCVHVRMVVLMYALLCSCSHDCVHARMIVYIIDVWNNNNHYPKWMCRCHLFLSNILFCLRSSNHAIHLSDNLSIRQPSRLPTYSCVE